MSTTIQEILNDTPSSTANVSVVSASIDSVIFYIMRENRWMLDSGCLDHVTHDISDFSEYQQLPFPQYIRLADGNTHISYIGIGTVMATTCVKGVQK